MISPIRVENLEPEDDETGATTSREIDGMEETDSGLCLTKKLERSSQNQVRVSVP